MDEHARGTLRFIKLLTELSFTSFQVTSQLGALSSLRVGVGQRPACTTEMGGMRPGGGSGPRPKLHGWSRVGAGIPRCPDAQASLLYKHIGQEALPGVAVGTQLGIATAVCWAATGDECPASCFTHIVRVIVTEPQEACRNTPLYRGENRLRGVKTRLAGSRSFQSQELILSTSIR